MNKSKKLQVKKVKKDRLIEQKPISKISLPWLIASAAVVVILVVALLFDQLYKPTLMRIDGKGYNISDLSYYFYTVESRYSYYDSLSGGYWDMTVDEETGKTVRDASKDEAVKLALFNEVLYNEAKAAGYSLTDEEKETIKSNVTALIGSEIPPADIRKNNFTKAYLTDILGRITLADRYREDKIKELNIDVEEVKKDIEYENYRQYDIETVSISKKTTDDDGNVVELTEEQKQEAYEKIKGIYETAKSTEDWSTLIADDESDLIYKEDNFLKDDTRFSEDMLNAMMAMNNGDISEIFDEDSAYYIVKMVNNNSTESYDAAVEDAVAQAEDEAFSDKFDNEILPKHEYIIIDKALKRYKMGNITISGAYSYY